MNDLENGMLEFSRRMAIDDIAPGGSTVEIEATAGERQKLAERFGLIGIDRLVAQLKLTRGASGIPIRIRGVLEATVVQECVVSLEPVSNKIKELIEVEYGPVDEESGEEVVSLDQPDPPEPLEGDSLELGELLAQHLSVALDPYPKLEGAAAPDWAGSASDAEPDSADKPFAALSRLRKNGG